LLLLLDLLVAELVVPLVLCAFEPEKSLLRPNRNARHDWH
jgi:hypothetical protein